MVLQPCLLLCSYTWYVHLKTLNFVHWLSKFSNTIPSFKIFTLAGCFGFENRYDNKILIRPQKQEPWTLLFEKQQSNIDKI